jgi:co-chaperonin GroES (HSP10)
MIRGIGVPNVEETKKKVTEALSSHTLPVPKGWKVLIAMPVFEEKISNSGIILPTSTKNAEEIAANIGLVVSMGSEAYKDLNKFPNGPWCEVGDFIMMRSYSGTRFSIGGHEFRMINDDTIEGVIQDPSGFTRA